MVVGGEMASAAKDIEQEAVSALVALGYKPQDASKVIGKLFKDGMSSEELIRQSLKSMI
jgi:Holliday junction DNA helicase RuvA